MEEEKDKLYVVESTLSLSSIGAILWIIFLVLKLAGPLNYLDWFWVWFPLWIVPAVELGLVLLVCIIAFIWAMIRWLIYKIIEK